MKMNGGSPLASQYDLGSFYETISFDFDGLYKYPWEQKEIDSLEIPDEKDPIPIVFNKRRSDQ